MSVAAVRVDRPSSPRFGLRFDRGRAQLVLGEPLEAGPLRLETLVVELAVAKGRVSLTDGWRAFRHRHTTLVEARVSIALPDLARLIGDAQGAEVSLVGTELGLSFALRTPAQSIAADVTWGFDGADLLLVASGARALPRGPRGPIAAAHDALGSMSAGLDAARGAARVVDPLHRALLEALLPSGMRIPATRGVRSTAHLAGGRFVITAGEGEAAEPRREHLEAARTLAGATAAIVDGDLARAGRLASEHTAASAPVLRARAIAHAIEAGEPRADADATPYGLALELTRALEKRPLREPLVSEAALAYARAEPHGGMAADALVLAAGALATNEAHRAAASALAHAALERLSFDRAPSPLDVALLSRAIELASAGASSPREAAAWEPIVRALAERAGAERTDVTIPRAHALALAHAGRPADAVAAFRAVLRREDDEPSAAGLALALGQLGRWDESLSAWDRVATFRESAGRGALAREARFRAACAAEQAGLVEAAIARLEAVLEEGPPDLFALEGVSALAARLAALGRADEAASLDRRLPAIVDALGPSFAIEGQSSLAGAIERCLSRGDEATARACLDALGRLVPGSERHASLARALDAAAASRLIEAGPAALRARADSLRRDGKHGEAARVLIELFAKTGDAAVLRAAVELVDRSGDTDARASVLDRALAILPPGAARESIERRRRS